MGGMMLWMLQGALTGSGVSGWALVAFVGAHAAIAAVLIGVAIFGARLSPRLRTRIQTIHRPILAHVGMMLAAAAITAGMIHLTLHGGPA